MCNGDDQSNNSFQGITGDSNGGHAHCHVVINTIAKEVNATMIHPTMNIQITLKKCE